MVTLAASARAGITAALSQQQRTAAATPVASSHASFLFHRPIHCLLLLCGNAEGDCKMKPLLIYHSANPRALKGLSKNMLPVHWASNKKAWVTGQVFEDWFTNHFAEILLLSLEFSENSTDSVTMAGICKHRTVGEAYRRLRGVAAGHPTVRGRYD